MHFRCAIQMTDEEIKSIYERICSDGLYDSFFWAAQCKSADDFLDWWRDAGTLGIEIRDGELVAMCALDHWNGRAAQFHYCIFRNAWTRTYEIAQATLDYLASSFKSRLSTIYGVTPVTNTLAVRFLKRNEFQVLGAIPKALTLTDGTIVDALMSYYDLEER